MAGAWDDLNHLFEDRLADLPPFNPGQPGVRIVPLAPAITGPTLYQMVLGVGVLTILTFALPRRFAVWIPPMILLGYASLHQDTVAGLLNSLATGIKNVGNAPL